MTTHTQIEFYVGDTWEVECTCHAAGGSALDLTGATIEWKLYSGGLAKVTKNLANGIVVTNAAGGVCLIILEPGETAPLAPGVYFDQVRVTTNSGEVSTQSSGRVNVRAVSGESKGTDTAAVEMSAQLERLKAARRSGARSVQIGDERAEYKSDREMAVAIAALSAEIDRTQGASRPKNVVLRSLPNRGW